MPSSKNKMFRTLSFGAITANLIRFRVVKEGVLYWFTFRVQHSRPYYFVVETYNECGGLIDRASLSGYAFKTGDYVKEVAEMRLVEMFGEAEYEIVQW